jgi:hypothetical protein
MSNPGPANPDPLDLTNSLDSLAELSASAAFLDLLKEIGNSAEADRPAVAARLATVAELERRGLPVTADNRLTLRYFEDRPGGTSAVIATDAPEPAVAEPPAPSDEAGSGAEIGEAEILPETLASDWTVCATTGYIQGGVLVCSSIGKKL